MRFFPNFSFCRSSHSSPKRVPSLELFHDVESTVTLDAATPKVAFWDYVNSLPSLNTKLGGFKDAYKFVPKKIRGQLHTLLSTQSAAPKGILKLAINLT